MIKHIHIKGKERKTRNGENFISWKAQKTDHTWDNLKFTMAVENAPDKAGHYIMIVDTVNMNRSQDDYGTVWWVKQVEEFADFVPEDIASEEF